MKIQAMRRAVRRACAPAIPLLLCSALCCSWASARPATAAQDAAQAQPADATAYTIQRVYKLKEVDRTKITSKATIDNAALGGNVTIVMLMVMKETTKEVKEDGTIVLRDEFEKALVNFQDKDMDMTADMPSITQTRDKTGRLVDFKTEGGSALFAQGASGQKVMSQVQQTLYPPKPVKVGDSWTIEIAPAKDSADKTTILGKATFVAVEKINGMDTLKIRSNFEARNGDKGNVTFKYEGVGNIDVKTGKIVRTAGTTDSSSEAMGKMKSELKLVLLGPDEKVDATTAAQPTAK